MDKDHSVQAFPATVCRRGRFALPASPAFRKGTHDAVCSWSQKKRLVVGMSMVLSLHGAPPEVVDVQPHDTTGAKRFARLAFQKLGQILQKNRSR